jgi:uncharacterized membrane protein YhaH (DUF805 family)
MQPRSGFGWFLLAIKKYGLIRGRSRRREFWYFLLFYVLTSLAAYGLGKWTGLSTSLETVVKVLLICPSIAVSIRRLHDTNRSGWWVLLPIVPILFYAQDSEQHENRFGTSPKSSR